MRSRAHGRHELSWLGAWWCRHGCGSSLVAEWQEWSCLVRSLLVLHSYAVAGAAVGAGCARVPPVSHGGFWKNFLFYVVCLAVLFALEKLNTSPSPSYLSAFSGVWVLPVEYSVLDFSGDPACTSLVSTVDTRSSTALEQFLNFSTLR